MKNKWYLSVLAIVFWLNLTGQGEAKFTVSVSTDSVLLGNFLKVSFKLTNASGNDFNAPPFDGFKVVSGPNISSTYNMVNGSVTQSVVYNYYLEPFDVGNYYILPASINSGGFVLETDPVEILVVPNPDGVIQKADPGDGVFHFAPDGFEFPGIEGLQSLDDWPGLDNFPELKDLPGLQDFLPAPKEPEKPRKKKKRKTVKI